MNVSFTRKIAHSVLILSLMVTAGCATTSQSSGDVDATGYYAGSWFGPNLDQPLGDLTCTITPQGDGKWNALFFAKYGGQAEYEVDLKGTTEGDSIVFAGKMNLGETSGGEFDWSGSIKDGVFNGVYTSSFISGTFKMFETKR